MTWLFHVVRLGLGAVMLYAGGLKALDPSAFAASLGRYELFPDLLLPLLGTFVPWLEIAGGGALLANRLVLGAGTVCCGLGASFILALGSAWARGLNIDCGCFGGGDPAAAGNLALALTRAVAVFGAAVAVTLLAARRARG